MARSPEAFQQIIPEATRALIALAFSSETAADKALDAVTQARRDVSYLYAHYSEALSEKKTRDIASLRAQRQTLEDAITVEYSKKVNPDTAKPFTSPQVASIVATNPAIASIEQRISDAEVEVIQIQTNANILEQELKNCDQRQGYLNRAYDRESQAIVLDVGAKGRLS